MRNAGAPGDAEGPRAGSMVVSQGFLRGFMIALLQQTRRNAIIGSIIALTIGNYYKTCA